MRDDGGEVRLHPAQLSNANCRTLWGGGEGLIKAYATYATMNMHKLYVARLPTPLYTLIHVILTRDYGIICVLTDHDVLYRTCRGVGAL